MKRVSLTDEAKADLQEIYDFWYETSGDIKTVAKNADLLAKDLRRIAKTPMLDRHDPELGPNNNRCWYYLSGAKFRIYYLRLAPNSIKVVRIWPSKRKPLGLDKVFKDEPYE